MFNQHKTITWFSQKMDNLRIHLSRPDALIQLSLLGLISGFVCGGTIVLFRILVETSQIHFLQGSSENYEILSLEERLLLPVTGSIFIAYLFHYFSRGVHVLGVARVIESMALFQGYLSLRDFFLQFVGAAVAIISGHSVGREGPIIFLGAASSSLIGQFLKLPNNSIRTLVGCGTAAGIAASFETPLAGVIFSLEVVMMEYSIVSFLPIILATGSATWIAVFFLGHEPSLITQDFYQGTIFDIPLVIVLGFIIGIFSALFVHLLQLLASKTSHFNFSFRIILAGFIIGMIAMIEPGVMGIGYDSLVQMLAGNILLNALLLLLLFKLLATVACLGLGIPGGVIGPALFLGACLGGIFALLIRLFFPELDANIGFYSLLGMGAMMGASLQAPLAALTAMMELRIFTRVILPGMVAIVTANLTASELFRKKSLFISMLESNGIDISANPVTQSLRRTGVASMMNKSIIQTPAMINAENLQHLISNDSQWLLLENNENEFDYIIPISGLACLTDKTQILQTDEIINLSECFDKENKILVAPIHLQATLEEALDKMKRLSLDVLYVNRVIAPGITRIYGIVTREQIEASYHV